MRSDETTPGIREEDAIRIPVDSETIRATLQTVTDWLGPSRDEIAQSTQALVGHLGLLVPVIQQHISTAQLTPAERSQARAEVGRALHFLDLGPGPTPACELAYAQVLAHYCGRLLGHLPEQP